MSGIFGRLVALPDVEDATIAVLNRWMPYQLADAERDRGLTPGSVPRPPAPESIYGGVDFLSYSQDLLPSLIVVVHAIEAPERSASIGYSQWYEVQVGALVQHDDEDSSRRIAGLYGAAIMGALIQGGYPDDIVDEVLLAAAPDTSLPTEDERRLHLNVSGYHVLVPTILDPSAGPAQPIPEDSPQYGGSPDAPFTAWPVVETVSEQIDAEPLSNGG